MARQNPPTHQIRRSNGTARRLTAGCAVVALSLSAAACGGDDDASDPIDTTDDVTTDESVTDTTGGAMDTADDMTTDDMTTDDMTTDDMTADDTTADDTTETTMASTVEDVLTDTLAGEGVDLFLTLLPIVGLDEITDADEVTILAPSDEAFQSVAADEIAAIIDDPTLVREVLEAHLVEAPVLSSDLADGDTITPLSGEEIVVSVDGDTVMLGQATVLRPDIMFDGGVIHVIDDIIGLPEF